MKIKLRFNSRKYYIISYNLKTTDIPIDTNEKFKKEFIRFLLLEGCKDITSLTETAILFGSDKRFDYLSESISKYFSYLIYFQFVEVMPHNEEFISTNADNKHFLKFNNLVKEVKSELGLTK